jgi:hypothetical protein
MKTMGTRITRRTFLRGAAVGGAGVLLLRHSASARTYAANEKVNVALVGVGGRGSWFVETLPKMENVVAFCDVDAPKIDGAFKQLADMKAKWAESPNSWEVSAAKAYTRLLEAKIKTFADYRKMLDELGNGLDAVVVATPDHTHAVIAAAAMNAGKAVFCEKPLTRAVGESRALRDLARKQKVATSMGNQGTYSGAFRRALELIQAGALGEVKETHVWNSGGGTDRKAPPKETPPVPEGMAWDLWLGPAAERPFHPDWLNRNVWRDFGTCQLGNWGSHSANLAFMALNCQDLWLAEPPKDPHPILRVQAKHTGINKLSFPKWEHIQWEVPPRADLPGITINWYNGTAPGRKELLDRLAKDAGDGEADAKKLDFAGTYIVGTKGAIHATGHCMSFRLLPVDQYKGVQRERPEKVENSRGPEQDWFAAIRGGKTPWASFDYADALNEFLMLGNVATQFQAKLDFDPRDCKITNNKDADALLRPEYRKGWTL